MAARSTVRSPRSTNWPLSSQAAHLPRGAELPVGPHQHLQAFGAQLDVHLHARLAGCGLRVPGHKAGACQLATFLRGGCQVAAVAQDAGRAAFAALQRQFGDVQPRALQACAQAVVQVQAVEQRDDGQFVGPQGAVPARIAACTGNAHIGVQAAGDAPAGRREHGPDADVGQVGLGTAGEGVLRPGPAFGRALQGAAHVGTQVAGAFGVPQQLGADFAVAHLQLQARVLDAGAHAAARHALLLHGAIGTARHNAFGADDGDIGGGFLFHHGQADVATGAFQHHVGHRAAACGVDVPAPVQAQVAADAGGGQRAFAGSAPMHPPRPAECLAAGPGFAPASCRRCPGAD
jgi:hypothetical protein